MKIAEIERYIVELELLDWNRDRTLEAIYFNLREKIQELDNTSAIELMIQSCDILLQRREISDKEETKKQIILNLKTVLSSLKS